MFTDYVDPAERAVACPNQDVVYGLASIALDLSPVVVQVPDFGDRFWVSQIVDLRSDSFVQLGKMYATNPGFYLLVGPHWRGEVPKGINRVFRSSANTGFCAPRVFQDDTPEDNKAVQAVLPQVLFYPLSDFDGTMTHNDFYKLAVELLVPKDTPNYWSEYRAGTITHFEALRRYFATIRSPEEEVLRVSTCAPSLIFAPFAPQD